MSDDTNKKLRKEIANVFRKFSMDPHHTPLKKQKDRETVGRFIDRIHNTEFDTGSLPYYSKDGLAKHRNKSECVFALMCDVIVHYWCLSDQAVKLLGKVEHYTKQIEDKLKRLETVYSNYDQLNVIGDAKGYCLFASQLPKPKKEVTDGSKEIESKPASEEVSPEETNERLDSPATCEEAQVDCADCINADDGGNDDCGENCK
jgi:hypothetical protein